ncbi:transmembrane adaptor Erv26-domain-containing protein [Halteromyces radiatus]|uniref:transmembrane adaptor Erv26-domain-containing protein n=1 Tax=Halteromyces radiatus TaxID=101107 RepID=UPI00222011D9|nr:transmembrane adaptor Erv26-domain-containing protein [Halteromyces radiatus]KAI8089232.1 transmembrane adaptor Erv26-domain-containing protein [Halteromyces radiatus]
MNFLHLVAYGATGLAFCFLVLSLACGLYYLAELVEEYTVYTKKVIKVMTMVVVAIHFLLCIFDRLPVLQLLFSVFCHGVYSLNLQTFPFIQLSSLPFISSCVLVFVDHFLWFKYFTRYYRPFMDIASFFGICVWLIPFTYFISLSANDNALPLSDPSAADMIPHQQKTGLFKTLFGFLGIKQQQSQQDQSFSSQSFDLQQPSYHNIQTPYNTNMTTPVSRSHYASNQLQNRKAL